jgi:glyoxylate/hydroxypyruvate reductase A
MVLVFCSDVDDPRPWRAALTQALPELDFRVWPDAGPPDRIEYALVWRPPPGMLAGLTRLKAILSLGAGVDHVLADPQLPRHVPLTRMVDAGLAAQMSEYALYGVLHFHRSMDRYAELQRQGEWRQLPAVPAHERTVGVLGLGVLGADFARKAAALGFRVLGWSRSPKDIPGVQASHGDAALPAFLAQAHILVNFLPLTPHTQGILDAKLFARLPRGASLINLARGAHLVDADLLDALASGQMAGAMLDVFGREPLPAAHPFWTHPRVIVTPHIAAQAIASLMVEQVVDNIRRIERGEVPLGRVDVQRGY